MSLVGFRSALSEDLFIRLLFFREMNEGSPNWLGFLPFPLILLMFMSHSFGCVTGIFSKNHQKVEKI